LDAVLSKSLASSATAMDANRRNGVRLSLEAQAFTDRLGAKRWCLPFPPLSLLLASLIAMTWCETIDGKSIPFFVSTFLALLPLALLLRHLGSAQSDAHLILINLLMMAAWVSSFSSPLPSPSPLPSLLTHFYLCSPSLLRSR
jgi:hypothetical protein